MNVIDYPFAGLEARSPEARRLGELHELARERVAQMRQVRADAAGALAAVGQASEALTDALGREAEGEKADTVKLTARLREAEKRAGEPWAQRIEAAERVAQRALDAYKLYARDEDVAVALHAEMLPHAYRDEAELLEAFEQLAKRAQAHREHEHRMTALARLCGYEVRRELPVSNAPTAKQVRQQAQLVRCIYPPRYAPAADAGLAA